MDVVFALAHNEGVSPVAVSLRKDVPRAGTIEADEILGLTNRANTGSNEAITSGDLSSGTKGERKSST